MRRCPIRLVRYRICDAEVARCRCIRDIVCGSVPSSASGGAGSCSCMTGAKKDDTALVRSKRRGRLKHWIGERESDSLAGELR